MPLSSLRPNQLRFSGLRPLLSQASPVQRVLSLGVNKLESGESGFAHTKFLQDTLSVWGTRMVASRSGPENLEITFLEFLESGLVYYGIGFLGTQVFQKAFRKMAAGKRLEPDVLKLSLKEIAEKSPNLIRKALPIRLATIIATLGMTCIAGEYSLLFIKNLLTAKVFNKESFSDVVALSDNPMDDIEQSETVQKAHRRIAQCLGITTGLVLLATGVARFGGGFRSIKMLQKLAEKMDFNFKNGKMSLSRSQFLTFMAVSIVAYLDSSRDDLERKEVATRLAIVMSYLAYGEEMIKGTLIKAFGQRFPELLKADEKGQKVPKNLEELGQEALAYAKSKLQKVLPVEQITEKRIQDEAAKHLKPLLKGKNALFLIPHAIGILGVGLGTALLNRYWTEIRYKADQQVNKINLKPQALPVFPAPENLNANFEQYVFQIRKIRSSREKLQSPAHSLRPGYRLMVQV